MLKDLVKYAETLFLLRGDKMNLLTIKNLFFWGSLFLGMQAYAETLAETVTRFEKMGMPSVAGAEYVNVDVLVPYDREKLRAQVLNFVEYLKKEGVVE